MKGSEGGERGTHTHMESPCVPLAGPFVDVYIQCLYIKGNVRLENVNIRFFFFPPEGANVLFDEIAFLLQLVCVPVRTVIPFLTTLPAASSGMLYAYRSIVFPLRVGTASDLPRSPRLLCG